MISQTIGWTLIHSLWQGLLIYVLVKIGMQFTKRADVRYGMAVSGLGLMMLSSVITFLIMNVKPDSEGFNLIVAVKATGTSTQSVLSWIDANIIWLLRFWVLGLVAGLLRIAAGLLYINRLRRNASPVQDEWGALVQDLSTTLNITKVVTMAEAAIASPMVVGFMKPMILFPVGLLAGLTTEQVETILVHELSHIRRQDYIINLVQSVIETIFFFNPFALLISSLIREERENCCDDLVIEKGISPISYVKTLAQLEAARSSSTLALGIAGNQNQLLNRIKRIMEKSAKNDWGKGRLVPVALLFLGLICASWLSIGTEKKEQEVKVSQDAIKTVMFVSDTSKKDGLKVLKKKDNHTDNDWVLVEPIEPTEVEVLDFPPVPDFDEMLNFPPVPDFAFNFDEMTGITFDSIPGHRFRIRDGEDWEAFEQEFTEKFKERFKDFYSKNQKQFDKMLDDMRRSEIRRDDARSTREAAEIVELDDMAHMMLPQIEARQGMPADVMMEFKSIDEKMRAEEARAYAEVARTMARENLNIARDEYRRSAEIYEDMARRHEEFQKELTTYLVADGYIKSGERIDHLEINDSNGKMTINGKSIKEKDRIKYKALSDKYFQTDRVRVIPGRSE